MRNNYRLNKNRHILKNKYNKKITKSIETNNIDSVKALLKHTTYSEFLSKEAINYCVYNNLFEMLELLLLYKSRGIKDLSFNINSFIRAFNDNNFNVCDLLLPHINIFNDFESESSKFIFLIEFGKAFQKEDREQIEYFNNKIYNKIITEEEILSYQNSQSESILYLINKINFKNNINNF